MLTWLCGCDPRLLVRLDRAFWMRLIPGRRHYYCPRCRRSQFLSRKTLKEALPGASDLLNSETTHGVL
jgi:hypothetical protein